MKHTTFLFTLLTLSCIPLFAHNAKLQIAPIGKLDAGNTQSFVVWNNYLIVGFERTVYKVYDLNSFKLLQTGLLSHEGTTAAHSNMVSLGVAENKDATPLCYFSHWDGDKGCIGYRLQDDLTLKQEQVIIPSEELKQNPIFGQGNTDFIIDKKNQFLYSIGYKINSFGTEPENTTCICKFALPKITDGTFIELTSEDILDYFEIENIATRQDACIIGNKLYINNGFVKNPYVEPVIRIVNLNKKKIVRRLYLKEYKDSEIEAIDINGNNILFTYAGDPTVYKLKL